MKKVLILLLLVCSMALYGDYYVGIDVNLGKGKIKIKKPGGTSTNHFSEIGFAIHGGFNLSVNSQVEFFFKKLNFDFTEGRNLDTKQLGVDYIYSFDKTTAFKPYVGIGMSVNNLDFKIENKDTVDGIGVKLRGGSYYALTHKLDIGAELNYNYIGWKDLRSNSEVEYSDVFYGLGLNLNYKF